MALTIEQLRGTGIAVMVETAKRGKSVTLRHTTADADDTYLCLDDATLHPLPARAFGPDGELYDHQTDWVDVKGYPFFGIVRLSINLG